MEDDREAALQAVEKYIDSVDALASGGESVAAEDGEQGPGARGGARQYGERCGAESEAGLRADGASGQRVGRRRGGGGVGGGGGGEGGEETSLPRATGAAREPDSADGERVVCLGAAYPGRTPDADVVEAASGVCLSLPLRCLFAPGRVV